MTPEGRVKQQITRELEALGFWRAGVQTPPSRVNGWFFMPVNNGMGVGGIPDYLLCQRRVITPDMVGQAVGLWNGIEAKAPKGRPTDRQLDRHHEIRSAGGLVLVCDNVSTLAQDLSAYGRKIS